MFVVNVMLEQLILRATARVLALASVTITLDARGRRDAYAHGAARHCPRNDRQLWLKLLHLDLEAHPPQAAILAVTLDAEPGSTSKVQLGLFSPQLPEPSRLDVTLARIRAIVGDGNVGRIVLEDTHRPDAFRIEPFTVPTAQAQDASARSARPAMRRLRPAEALTVIFESQRPKAFVFHGQRFAVERVYGPWRMEGRLVERDTVGMRAMGPDGPRPGRRCALLLPGSRSAARTVADGGAI